MTLGPEATEIVRRPDIPSPRLRSQRPARGKAEGLVGRPPRSACFDIKKAQRPDRETSRRRDFLSAGMWGEGEKGEEGNRGDAITKTVIYRGRTAKRFP